jgi:hypothetical protein
VYRRRRQTDNCQRMTPLRAVAGAVLALLLSIAAITRADPDLWGHVRFGVDILETRELPSDDPYSFTQDRPWINHEWLSELFMGAAWTIGGTPGLTLLKAPQAKATRARDRRGSLRTGPSRAATMTSMGKRSPKVWMALVGARRAAPGVRPSRLRRPRLRIAESNTGSIASARVTPRPAIPSVQPSGAPLEQGLEEVAHDLEV